MQLGFKEKFIAKLKAQLLKNAAMHEMKMDRLAANIVSTHHREVAVADAGTFYCTAADIKPEERRDALRAIIMDDSIDALRVLKLLFYILPRHQVETSFDGANLVEALFGPFSHKYFFKKDDIDDQVDVKLEPNGDSKSHWVASNIVLFKLLKKIINKLISAMDADQKYGEQVTAFLDDFAELRKKLDDIKFLEFIDNGYADQAVVFFNNKRNEKIRLLALLINNADVIDANKILAFIHAARVDHWVIAKAIAENYQHNGNKKDICIAIIKQCNLQVRALIFCYLSPTAAEEYFGTLDENDQEQLLDYAANKLAFQFTREGEKSHLRMFFDNLSAYHQRRLLFYIMRREKEAVPLLLYQTPQGKRLIIDSGAACLQDENNLSKLADEKLKNQVAEFTSTLTSDERAQLIENQFNNRAIQRSVTAWEDQIRINVAEIANLEAKDREEQQRANESKEVKRVIQPLAAQLSLQYGLQSEIKEAKNIASSTPQNERQQAIARLKTQNAELQRNIKGHVEFIDRQWVQTLPEKARLKLLLNKKLFPEARGKLLLQQSATDQRKYLKSILSAMKEYDWRDRAIRQIFVELLSPEDIGLSLKKIHDADPKNLKHVKNLFNNISNFQYEAGVLTTLVKQGKAELAAELLRDQPLYRQYILLDLMTPEEIGPIFKYMAKNDLFISFWRKISLGVPLLFSTSCLSFGLFLGAGILGATLGKAAIIAAIFASIVTVLEWIVYLCLKISWGDNNLGLLGSELPRPARDAIFCNLPFDSQAKYLADSRLSDERVVECYRAAVIKDHSQAKPLLLETIHQQSCLGRWRKPERIQKMLIAVGKLFLENRELVTRVLADFSPDRPKQAFILKGIHQAGIESPGRMAEVNNFLKDFSANLTDPNQTIELLNSFGKSGETSPSDLKLKATLLFHLANQIELKGESKIVDLFKQQRNYPHLHDERSLFATLAKGELVDPQSEEKGDDRLYLAISIMTSVEHEKGVKLLSNLKKDQPVIADKIIQLLSQKDKYEMFYRTLPPSLQLQSAEVSRGSSRGDAGLHVPLLRML